MARNDGWLVGAAVVLGGTILCSLLMAAPHPDDEPERSTERIEALEKRIDDLTRHHAEEVDRLERLIDQIRTDHQSGMETMSAALRANTTSE